MVLLVLLFFLYPFPSAAQQERQYLHYKFTVLTGTDSFPEFSAESVCDDRKISQYSNEDIVWVRHSMTNWTEAPKQPPDSKDWFIYQLKTLANCTNTQCPEVHVLQRIIGCELEKFPNGTVTNLTVFDEYGFDGEDFIAFNYDTMQWIDKNPKAKRMKIKWDHQKLRNQFIQRFLKTCADWISTFNNTNKTQPDIHIFARKASDDHSKLVLTCLATSFNPRNIEMNIRLDRSVLENQTSTEIRPNSDGSFQMRSSVEIDRNYKGSYDCFVIHSSLAEPVSTEWDGTCFDCETKYIWIIITGVAAVLVIIFIVTCCCIFKKKRSNGQRTNYCSERGYYDNSSI